MNGLSTQYIVTSVGVSMRQTLHFDRFHLTKLLGKGALVDYRTTTRLPSHRVRVCECVSSKKSVHQLLAEVAEKDARHSSHLSVLAHQNITKVKNAIDDMIIQLGKEKEDEVKHKDFCADEFNTN